MVRTAELGVARDQGEADPGDRLRHGRHLDRRHPLRRRVRARVRDQGRRRARARADDGIHTVAAGGGSILAFDGARFRVGPESAGANPGPACYRRGGPLTVTDANVMLGKIQPGHFPHVFGPAGDEPLDGATSSMPASTRSPRRSPRRPASARSPEQSRRGLHRHRRRRDGQCDQEDLGRARLRRHALHLAVLRRRRRPARLPRRRRARHGARLHPSARRRALGLRHGPGRPDGDAPGRARAAARRRAAPRSRRASTTLADAAAGELDAAGRRARRGSRVHRRVHLRYEGTDSALVVAVRRRGRARSAASRPPIGSASPS